MATVKLDIPYRSQWDTDAKNHEPDCVPTCVAMLLNKPGVEITPDEVYQVLPPGHGGPYPTTVVRETNTDWVVAM